MKKYIILFAFFLTACGGSTYPQGTPTPTPNPAEIALQMFQQQVASEATQQIVGLQFTATAQVLGVTATQQAYETQAAITERARIDAQATADQARQDAQATQQRIDAQATADQARRDAQATAEQARLDLQATQTAEQIATSFAMTQAVVPTHNMWTQQAVEQDILLKADEVEKSALEVAQQTEKNTWDWAYPIGVSAVMVVAFLLYVKEHGRVREIKDADGNIETIIINNEKMITPRLMPKPLLMLESGDMPDVTDPENQKDIVKRDQAIRALGNMPVSPTGPGAQAFNAYFGEPVKQAQPFEIVNADAVPAGLLDVEGIKAIEKDWKEANDQ